MLRYPVSMLVFITLAGCATLPPVTPPATSGKVDTLTASVSVSVGGKGGGSASGFLVYQRPDRFRVTVVTPFGLPALDAFLVGDRVTVVVPGDQTAYVGKLADLPREGSLAPLSDVPAAADIDWRPDAPGKEVVGSGGEFRRYDESGLLVQKRLPSGETVVYERYADAGGFPLPTAVKVFRPDRMTISIKLEEPQVNAPLEGDSFSPNLQGARLLPLSLLAPPPPSRP